MADDDFQFLMKAREALVNKRQACAQIIAGPGEISEGAIKSIVGVQQAIDVIDVAIEELEEAQLDEELEETED
jgi:hypothetical protein